MSNSVSYSLNNRDDWELLRKKLIDLSTNKIEFSLEKEKDFKRIVLKY